MGDLIKQNVIGIIKWNLLVVMLFFQIFYLLWDGMGILIMFVFIGFTACEAVRTFALKTSTDKIPALERWATILGIPMALLMLLAYGVYIGGSMLLLYTILSLISLWLIEQFVLSRGIKTKNEKAIALVCLSSNIILRIGIAFGFLICASALATTSATDSWQMPGFSLEQYNRQIRAANAIRLAFGSLSYICLLSVIILKTVVSIIIAVDNNDSIKAYFAKLKAEAVESENKKREQAAQKQQEAVASANENQTSKESVNAEPVAAHEQDEESVENIASEDSNEEVVEVEVIEAPEKDAE